MKKILALLAIGLFINLSISSAQCGKAENSSAVSEFKNEGAAVPAGTDVKCQGVSKTSTHSCAGTKTSTSTSTTLSENHSNTGSSTVAESKSCSKEASSKACCKPGSKASALAKAEKGKNKSEVAVKEKETAPQQ